MRKVMATVSTLLICVAVLAGCGKVDPVQDDLINYLNNQLVTLVESSNKVTTEYAAATGTNFVDDDTLAVKLSDIIIPASDGLLAKINAIVPATEEVRKVHSQYIAAMNEQNEAFKLLLQAAQKHDETMVKAINDKLANADKVADEYLAALEALKKEHNVENAT